MLSWQYWLKKWCISYANENTYKNMIGHVFSKYYVTHLCKHGSVYWSGWENQRLFNSDVLQLLFTEIRLLFSTQLCQFIRQKSLILFSVFNSLELCIHRRLKAYYVININFHLRENIIHPIFERFISWLGLAWIHSWILPARMSRYANSNQGILSLQTSSSSSRQITTVRATEKEIY